MREEITFRSLAIEDFDSFKYVLTFHQRIIGHVMLACRRVCVHTYMRIWYCMHGNIQRIDLFDNS
jgi:hypothetical protein